MTGPDPGRVLRRALVAWGLGHLTLGRRTTGRLLLAAEALAMLLIAWLTIGLADTSAHLVPFMAGVAFIVAWAWQAVDAYQSARSLQAARPPTPARSPAAAIGWLSIPVLLWGTGFWLVGAQSATPASVLDRFVTAWSRDQTENSWPAAITREADAAASRLGPGSGTDRFRDIRIRLISRGERRAMAVAEAVHYERRESRILWVFTGIELVPVADEQLLILELVARPAGLLGGGDIGAVRWELVAAQSG